MEKYNGYTNYPTWAVKLWIDNDYVTYHFWREKIKNLRYDIYQIEEALKEWTMQQFYSYTAGLASDLTTWSVEQVNFHEIAEMLLEEVD